MEKMKRLHVYYSGTVQGVGFRFTAERIANNLGLYGWVKNLPDGRVELAAEGEEDTLKALLDGINQSLKSHIRTADIDYSDTPGEFSDFRIEF